MNMKCPGENKPDRTADVYQCPGCGTEVRMFSDELRIQCGKCGRFVYKEKAPSCIERCPAARHCLGAGRLQASRGED
jgi:ribosomal protein S27AE